MGVLLPKCVLTILTVKVWDPHTPSSVLNVLTLKLSVFLSPLAI